MKSALVIGGTGYLGAHLIEGLKAMNCDIHAIQNKRPLPQSAGISVISGGIKSVNSRLINQIRPEIIFHLARPVFPYLKKYGRMMAAQLASKYNKNLIDALGCAEVQPLLVFASGSLMYGNSDQKHNELAPLNPVSYARQYFTGELPLLRCLSEKTYPVALIRLPWLLGNGSWFKWFYLKNISEKKTIPAFGNMTNMMEVIDVKDAVQLMLRIAMKHGDAGVYNIITQGALSQRCFAGKVAEVFSVKIMDHTQVTGKIEKAAMEAFTSSIQLDTLHPDIFHGFSYKSLSETLEWIRDEHQH